MPFQHDEATEECTPGEFGNSNGNYIMFASATDGSKTNNRKFSPCSKPRMANVIRAKGGCLVAGWNARLDVISMTSSLSYPFLT
jgi:hypothetical protein